MGMYGIVQQRSGTSEIKEVSSQIRDLLDGATKALDFEPKSTSAQFEHLLEFLEPLYTSMKIMEFYTSEEKEEKENFTYKILHILKNIIPYKFVPETITTYVIPLISKDIQSNIPDGYFTRTPLHLPIGATSTVFLQHEH